MRRVLRAIGLILLVACADEPSSPNAGFSLPFSNGISTTGTPSLPVTLGTLPGYPYSLAEDVNDRGQVAGNAYWPFRGFIWSAGTIRDLGSLRPDGAGATYAHAINELGEVVGYSNSSASGKSAFVWVNGIMRDLNPGVAGESEALDINDHSDIAGHIGNRAALWPSGAGPTLLPSFPDPTRTFSIAAAINNSQMIVGKVFATPGWLEERPFVWTPTAGMVDPGLPPGAVAGAFEDVNDAGQAAGYVIYPPPIQRTWSAVRWSQASGWEDLGLRADSTQASQGLTIAPDGTVGGDAYTRAPYNGCYRSDSLCATVWAPDGTPSLMPSGLESWSVLSSGFVDGLNDAGQAVGWADLPGFAGALLWQYRPSTTVPTAVIGGVLAGVEGDTIYLDGSQSSDPLGGSLVLRWDLGDGSRDSGAALSHRYLDNDGFQLGHFAQLLAVRDDGTFGAASARVMIQNLSPTVSLSGPAQLSPGEAGSFDFTMSDPGVLDAPWLIRLDWGDGTPTTALTQYSQAPGSASHTYATPGTKRVILTVFDKDNGGAEDTLFVVVPQPPRPPVANPGGSHGVEGLALTLDASGSSDPDGGTLDFQWDFGDGTAGTGMIVSHTYAQDGIYTATLVVTDPTGLTSAASAPVSVVNALPGSNVGGTGSTPVRKPLTLAATIWDLGKLDAPWTVAFDWGDGQQTTFTTMTLGPVPATHTYASPGTYTILFTVTDKDGATMPSNVLLTVTGEAPPVTAVAFRNPVAEGGDPGFDASQSTDPNGDPLTFRWTFGDGTTSLVAKPSKIYADNGTYAVTLTAMDSTKRGSVWSGQIVVNNVAPTATFTKPSSITEGSGFTISFSNPFDPSTADRAAGFSYAFDCGTGYGAFSAQASRTCPVEPDNRSVPVRGQVRDKDGGTSEQSRSLSVTNVAPKPTITATSPLTFPSGGTATFNGKFTDPGSLDAPWTYSIVWGDGTSPTTGTASRGTAFPLSHRYTRKGIWTVRLTVKDKDGGSGASNSLKVTVQ